MQTQKPMHACLPLPCKQLYIYLEPFLNHSMTPAYAWKTTHCRETSGLTDRQISTGLSIDYNFGHEVTIDWCLVPIWQWCHSRHSIRYRCMQTFFWTIHRGTHKDARVADEVGIVIEEREVSLDHALCLVLNQMLKWVDECTCRQEEGARIYGNKIKVIFSSSLPPLPIWPNL